MDYDKLKEFLSNFNNKMDATQQQLDAQDKQILDLRPLKDSVVLNDNEKALANLMTHKEAMDQAQQMSIGSIGGMKNVAEKLPNIGYGYFGQLRRLIKPAEEVVEASAAKTMPSALNSAVKLPGLNPEMQALKDQITKLSDTKGYWHPDVVKLQQLYNKKLK